ncbi:MAG: trypsin-like peptidase domain-containing protein [Dehalococcoidales bacterium]
MTNKVLIGILVFLIILSGALGTHSYLLSKEIDALSQQLTVFQDEFATFRGESITRSDALEKGISGTLVRIGTLEDKIDGTLTRIGTLEEEIGGTQSRIGTLEEELNGTLTRIGTLKDEIKNVAASIPETGINAISIYQRVSQAVVRISNGEEVIGSGFIVNANAHVLTAYHVIERLSQVDIILPDGSFSAATIIGSSKYSDIAVLQLEEPLATQPLTLADSATVRIGEPVVTIGNPFDLTETLTVGIVSQIDQLAEIEYATEARWVSNLIQFDAPVNFGNSGCPLLNSKAEVIGMVIARVDPREGDGIYHAVSSNKLKRVATFLIDQGFFDYPWLGVEIINLTPQVAQTRGLETINGALVKKVVADSPAEAAGIKVGDIIVAINGIAVGDVADLISYLGENTSPGEIVTIALIRDSAKLELSLTVGKRPS